LHFLGSFSNEFLAGLVSDGSHEGLEVLLVGFTTALSDEGGDLLGG
jgi:hypothetical protein